MEGIKFKRLDHLLITIPEGEKENARTFYSGVLELKEIPGKYPKGAIWYHIGDIQLHVREEKEHSLSSRHPAFEVEGLEQAKAFLEKKNIQVSDADVIDGRDRCFFTDPFGNRFELLSFNSTVTTVVS